jgi:hypothetical protein
VFQTTFVPLQGASAVLLSYIFLGEPPTVGELAGGAVILLGLACAVFGQYGFGGGGAAKASAEEGLLEGEREEDGGDASSSSVEVDLELNGSGGGGGRRDLTKR